MAMLCTRLALIAVTTVIVSHPGLAEQKKRPPPSMTVSYLAETIAPALRQGGIVAGSVNWDCRNTRCSGTTDVSLTPVKVCAELAREVGAMGRFVSRAQALSATDLGQCNVAAARSPVVTPALTFTGTGHPLAPGIVTTPTLRFAGTGQSLTATGWLPLNITTPTLSFAGIGRSLAPPAWAPITTGTAELSFVGIGQPLTQGAVITPALTFTGIGQPLTPPGTPPVSTTTPALTFTGTGSL